MAAMVVLGVLAGADSKAVGQRRGAYLELVIAAALSEVLAETVGRGVRVGTLPRQPSSMLPVRRPC